MQGGIKITGEGSTTHVVKGVVEQTTEDELALRYDEQNEGMKP